jgi:hypothetical protein
MQNKQLGLSEILLGAFMLMLSYCNVVSAQSATESIWPTKQWQTSTPEAQGMDSAALAGLVAFKKSHSFDSPLLVRHGRIVLDTYYAPYTADVPHVMNSSCGYLRRAIVNQQRGPALGQKLKSSQRAQRTRRQWTKDGDAGPSEKGHRYPKSGVLQKGPFIGSSRMDSATMVIPTSLRRLMPLQEGACTVDGAHLQLRRLLPGEHRDLGIRAERGNIDRSHQRMRGDVVR